MSQGYVKIHRSILHWEWWDDHNTTRLFLYCIMRANHAPKQWRGITIEAGQFVTSLAALSKATGLTVKQVRLSMQKLKSTGETASKGTNKYTILTVCNYSTYNCQNTDEGKQEDKPRANKGQTKGNKQEVKKNEEEERKTPIVPTDKKQNKRFSPPTTEEVRAYVSERMASGNPFVDAAQFVDYYTANGWKVGKNVMKDWRAAVRTWERNRIGGGTQQNLTANGRQICN